MRKVYGLVLLVTMIVLVSGFASAYDRPCDTPKDLCTWTTNLNGPTNNPLPLGSGEENAPQCGLNHNTFWPIGTQENPTQATATCVFDGSNLNDIMLYLSIDNDIVSCTLNGVEVFGATSHEDCAPADPRNGYSKGLTVIPGENTLVCTVADRGVMSHFDACVTGTSTTPTVPEFGPIIGLTTVLGALGLFFFVRKK